MPIPLDLRQGLTDAGIKTDPGRSYPEVLNGLKIGNTQYTNEELNAGLASSASVYLEGAAPGETPTASKVYIPNAAGVVSITKITGIANGTQLPGKAIVNDGNTNQGVAKVTALHIGPSGSETQVTATAAQLNVLGALRGATLGGKLYAAFSFADEDVVTDTDVATAFTKSYTIPADALAVGDILRIKAFGVVDDDNSTDTLELKVKLGDDVVATIAAADVSADNIFRLSTEVYVAGIGETGLLICETLKSDFAALNSETYTREVEAVTPDTTDPIPITIEATWSVAHEENIVALQGLIVDRI